MKVLLLSLAFIGTAALACPYGDVKDAQAPARHKAVAEVKAPAQTPVAATKTVAARKAETKVAARPTVELRKPSSL